MDTLFSAFNVHRHAPESLWEADHHLRQLRQQPYLYENPLIHNLPRNIPGIYSIGGGRQIGKTTLLKQWIAALIKDHVEPHSIVFFTGELINDHHQLVNILQPFISDHQNYSHLYIIIDEITYIQHWDKGIKFMADAGYFQQCTVVLTGSDLTLMQSARMTFPGRRGTADRVDFHLYPLSFKEVLTLKQSLPTADLKIDQRADLPEEAMRTLYDEFDVYLRHGGYLNAINDIARDGEIKRSTLTVYSDWIRGDMLKRDKQENYLKELLLAIIKRYNKKITWHALADTLSIDSHKTVADYCELLTTMDALFIQSALLLDKLTAAPKKARKLTFTDPFIFHAIKCWLQPTTQNPYQRIITDLNDTNICADLVDAVLSNHYRRHYPTYYIKAEKEIDIAYVDNERFWPIEIKWRNQLRPNELKYIAKYPQARIFSKIMHRTQAHGISIEPLPLALLAIG